MKNFQLKRNRKLEILRLLAKQEIKIFKKIDPIVFFDEILDLKNLPSTDPRYKDARGDLIQHYINNNDWDLDFILLERFDFLNSDENFIKLVNKVISPEVNEEDDDIKFFYHTLNPIFKKNLFEYRLKGIDENGLSIFEIDEFDE